MRYAPTFFRCHKKDVNATSLTSLNFEPKPGLEPGTYSLRMNCSTNWAISAGLRLEIDAKVVLLFGKEYMVTAFFVVILLIFR